MKAKDLIKIMKKAGWVLKEIEASHHNYIHPDHPELGKVTVPVHGGDLKPKTFASIKRQTGLKF